MSGKTTNRKKPKDLISILGNPIRFVLIIWQYQSGRKLLGGKEKDRTVCGIAGMTEKSKPR